MDEQVIHTKDVDNIIDLLDSMVDSGISRIKVNTSDTQEAESVSKAYHHGRCDVGSPWAKGTVKNMCDIDVK